MDSEHMMTALDGLRDAVFLAKDEVGKTGTLSAATWQRLGDNYTVVFFLMRDQVRREVEEIEAHADAQDRGELPPTKLYRHRPPDYHADCGPECDRTP